MQSYLLKPMGRKPWSSSYLGKLHQRIKGTTPSTIKSSSFHWNNTPSKTSKWWQSSICSTRITSSSYQRFGTPMKLDVQMIPTTASSTGWHVILPANALSQRQDSSISWCWVLTLKSEQKKVTANIVTLDFGTSRKWPSKMGLLPPLKQGWNIPTRWTRSKRLKVSSLWQQNLGKSCKCT